MATVHETYDFDVPVERLYEFFSDHENLGPVLGLNVKRIKEGETEPNGVGSVRKLSAKGLMPFEETVTEAIPNERIEYRVTKGTPLKNHLGVQVFSSTGEGKSHLDYTITFDTRSRASPADREGSRSQPAPRLPQGRMRSKLSVCSGCRSTASRSTWSASSRSCS